MSSSDDNKVEAKAEEVKARAQEAKQSIISRLKDDGV